MATSTNRILKKFIGEGLKESGPNRNVLNVLRLLIEDEGSTLFIPANYERGTRKRVDESVHHGFRYAPVAMPVTDFVPNMDRFNFSVRGLKEVLVENKETGDLDNKKVFRTYNVIRDGQLHIEKIEATLSEQAYVELVCAGILYNQVGKLVDGESMVYKADYVYTIDLSQLPLVSTHWAQPKNIGFVEFMEDEAYLTEFVKSLNKIEREWRSKLISEGTHREEESDVYIESTQYATEESTESMEVNCVLYRIQSKALKDRIKEAKDIEHIAGMYESYNELKSDLKYYKKKLSYARFIIRAVAFAIENTKKQGSYEWSPAVPLPRSKNKMVERAVLEDDRVLEKITWTESIPL